MPDTLELKKFEGTDSVFVEITSIADWAPALRILIKQFESDADKGIPFKGKEIYVKISNRKAVKVSPLFPTDGEINKVSGIQTFDDTYGSHPLSTLVATSRIKEKPEFIVSSLKAEDYDENNNSNEDNQIKRHADIAAVEHGISEQAYGGRTAIIATMMVNRYGQLLIQNKIDGRPTGKFDKQDKEKRDAYHTVYLGTGNGGAAILAAHQNYTQKIKIGELTDEEGNPGPTLIAAQLEAIYNDLIELSEELRNTILAGVVAEAENVIEALYTEEGTDEDRAIVENLKQNLQGTAVFIKQEGKKLLSVEKAQFEKASRIKNATEFKTRGRSRSDAGDLVSKSNSVNKNIDLEEQGALIALKGKNKKRKMEVDDSSNEPPKKKKKNKRKQK
ncbi:hypothetical protein [Aquimarina aggregata]|uniref:hypothetical protein n=1 Tax=Aquimarina aggregata TaxID=1642818 RepID=UPI00248FE540|nr:hypothetical protein [Aquimarina aggregata]